jgi:hypothetical protein
MREMLTKIRVNSFSISIDGYGAGPDQDIDHPLGVGGEGLHLWSFETRTFQQTLFGADKGTTGIDDDFIARGFENVGAWILGRNMFGPIRGPWPDMEWKGWWGDNPPIMFRFLFLPIMRVRPSKWTAVQRFTLSQTASTRHLNGLARLPKAKTCALAEGPTLFNSICVKASLMSFTSQFRRSCWAKVSGCLMGLTCEALDTSATRLWLRRMPHMYYFGARKKKMRPDSDPVQSAVLSASNPVHGNAVPIGIPSGQIQWVLTGCFKIQR